MTKAERELLMELALIVRRMAPPGDQNAINARLAALSYSELLPTAENRRLYT